MLFDCSLISLQLGFDRVCVHSKLLFCVQVLVKAGDRVTAGDPLMVMIAMKMEVREPPPPTHSQNTHLTLSEHVTTLISISAAHDPGAQVGRDQEGFLQRGLSGQSPRSFG